MQAPQPRSAVQVIMREHQQLSTVIAGMQRFVELLGADAKTPGLMVFRAMLYYIREYPERVHHPKENQYLFARLWHRTRELDPVIADLEAQHAQGEARIRDIEHALTRYELAGKSALPDLRGMLDEYAAFYSNHRRLEEEIILPAARQWLTAEDWIELDDAFGANRDPFEGAKLDEDFERLFSLIVQTIPEAQA
ncbi:hemerythrin domain-containing protein [Paraburkholderia sp. BL10I2N1]|uniref:hemerythrin domain-containing protein n=1 Tax=Paraburkholderia sp. BL10I2N1 TaxID=1938796 RepID=UPI001061F650|nr:hemerythrin domain-containing protein [Paraburkholderia sp. BL10I2N1]TDN63196.1 hemerythrin-like domain-containing protein [Paraburkholderia sp. BL10I2N1]